MGKKALIAKAVLLALAATGAAAQSLGDYARNVRKDKPASAAASRHYDNDNLPSRGQINVVGSEGAKTPVPAGPSSSDAAAKSSPAASPATGNTDRQKAAEEIQKKIQDEQSKLDGLTHELDLDQREYRLRAAAFYSDAGSRLRDSKDWDKQDAQYKADMEAKQKGIADAQQKLEELKEEARKAGITEQQHADTGASDKTKDKDSDK